MPGNFGENVYGGQLTDLDDKANMRRCSSAGLDSEIWPKRPRRQPLISQAIRSGRPNF